MAWQVGKFGANQRPVLVGWVAQQVANQNASNDRCDDAASQRQPRGNRPGVQRAADLRGNDKQHCKERRDENRNHGFDGGVALDGQHDVPNSSAQHGQQAHAVHNVHDQPRLVVAERRHAQLGVGFVHLLGSIFQVGTCLLHRLGARHTADQNLGRQGVGLDFSIVSRFGQIGRIGRIGMLG